jgi:AcrR family transcriptional regulator
MPRTTQPDRRAQLIHAASGLFSQRAYDEVTTTEIAQRAGVSYGLIAHHFGNKRGIYLAVINAAADQLRAIHDTPLAGTPSQQLRAAIDRHIRYIERHAAGFLALMRGGNGSDPDVRAIIDNLRWAGAQRILHALGVDNPPPTLRTAMHGWVGYLDEMLIDRLLHHDVPREHLVELAAATLSTTLRTATALDPCTGLTADTLNTLTST